MPNGLGNDDPATEIDFRRNAVRSVHRVNDVAVVPAPPRTGYQPACPDRVLGGVEVSARGRGMRADDMLLTGRTHRSQSTHDANPRMIGRLSRHEERSDGGTAEGHSG